jgi:hypothetical protein
LLVVLIVNVIPCFNDKKSKYILSSNEVVIEDSLKQQDDTIIFSTFEVIPYTTEKDCIRDEDVHVGNLRITNTLVQYDSSSYVCYKTRMYKIF